MTASKSTSITIVEDGVAVPASSLDQILHQKDSPVVKYLHSMYTGKRVNIKDEAIFHAEVFRKTTEKEYETTDHMPISMEINSIWYLYVSLDNSVRANQFGRALKYRLAKLCTVVVQAIKECGGSCVVYFSESCRPSFDGNNLDDMKDKMTWFLMREYISKKCSLYFLGECSNNEDSSNMAFGVSAFCTDYYRYVISAVIPRRILKEGFGSGAIGIEINGVIVWGVHFPLDFKNKGDENLGAITMKTLCILMNSCPSISYAFGNFNTIPGDITDAIVSSISEDMCFADTTRLTFFGAHYDRVKKSEWIPLI